MLLKYVNLCIKQATRDFCSRKCTHSGSDLVSIGSLASFSFSGINYISLTHQTLVSPLNTSGGYTMLTRAKKLETGPWILLAFDRGVLHLIWNAPSLVLSILSPRLNTFTWRTHTCGELNQSHAGKEVVICGWIAFDRCDKFLILRDSYGTTQVILKEDRITIKYLENLPLESVIQVKGIVQERPKKDINKKLPTGEIEIKALDVKLLNPSAPKLGITAKNLDKVTDSIKLKYRYLCLRSERIQKNLRLRSAFLMKMREFLVHEHGFIDVETPTLFKRTPGGAKEFIVPTKFPGKFYSLTQSPQQFKQMLMVGGIDRYFQIARCYRNEGTKPDRQPEFTQVDIELSFTTANDVQNLVESLLNYSWPTRNKIKVPFQRMTYDEAMRLYGTDKPDLRYELKIQDVTEDMIKAGFKTENADELGDDYGVFMLVLPAGSNLIKKSLIKDISKETETDSLKCFPINIRENLIWNGPGVKFIAEEQQRKINDCYNLKSGDLLFIAAGRKLSTCSALGKCRKKFAELLQFVKSDLSKNNEHSFVWITDFPLFLQEGGIVVSAHHPFTAPHPDDIDLIYTDPLKARGQHYDLVLNGQEIAGGSIRIHDSSLQKYILEEILKEKSEELNHLLEALKSGCPPHGGIALGFDRIVAILCNSHSIADVIAFPKSQDGKDLLSGAPSLISDEDKLLYHIQPIIEKE